MIEPKIESNVCALVIERGNCIACASRPGEWYSRFFNPRPPLRGTLSLQERDEPENKVSTFRWMSESYRYRSLSGN